MSHRRVVIEGNTRNKKRHPTLDGRRNEPTEEERAGLQSRNLKRHHTDLDSAKTKTKEKESTATTASTTEEDATGMANNNYETGNENKTKKKNKKSSHEDGVLQDGGGVEQKI